VTAKHSGRTKKRINSIGKALGSFQTLKMLRTQGVTNLGLLRLHDEQCLAPADFANPFIVLKEPKRLRSSLETEETYPYFYCDVCRWQETSAKHRRADDHLRYQAGSALGAPLSKIEFCCSHSSTAIP
jgi:hypothetical protein